MIVAYCCMPESRKNQGTPAKVLDKERVPLELAYTHMWTSCLTYPKALSLYEESPLAKGSICDLHSAERLEPPKHSRNHVVWAFLLLIMY
jgi:hypothetical protein